jgi:GGDEF domain-containing protein
MGLALVPRVAAVAATLVALAACGTPGAESPAADPGCAPYTAYQGHRGSTVTVRCTPRASIGVSRWDGEVPIDALMHDADQAMYAVKTGGKGRVSF